MKYNFKEQKSKKKEQMKFQKVSLLSIETSMNLLSARQNWLSQKETRDSRSRVCRVRSISERLSTMQVMSESGS